MLNWYLVQLKPNGHRLAKANLERQGFKTFLPLQNVTTRSAHIIPIQQEGVTVHARSGQLKNFTGIDSPYEAPEVPEIHIDTTAMSIDDAAEQIVKQLPGE